MNPQELPEEKLQDVDNPLKVMQPGERVLCEIKRHPIGLMNLYAALGFVIVLTVLVVALTPQIFPNVSSQGRAMIALGGVILCALVGLFTYVGATVYKGNRWIVTSDSITQISQVSLFRKQTSQLSLANLEDVTVEQNGILESMFGFGRLRAESAGERSKFVFDFCPKPSEYAKEIIGAHEAYIAEKPSEMHTTNQAVANAASFNQSYGQNQAQPPMQQAVPLNPQPQQPQQPSTPAGVTDDSQQG